MDQPIYKNSSSPSQSPPNPRKIILGRWAEFLTARKITPSDIDYTVEKSIREGEKEDSARNTELKEVRQALLEFQQTLPPEEQEKFEKERVIEAQKSSPSVQLPSIFNTTIYREVSLPFSSQTPVPGRQIFSSIRSRVFGPPISQGVKTAVQGVGQKSLQAVGGTLTKGTAAVLTKAGLHTVAAAVTGGIGNIIVVVAPKLFKTGSSLIKNTVGWVSSGFGLFTAFTEGLTGQREVPENKDLKFLLFVVGGTLAMLLFLGIFQIITISGSFIVPPSPLRYGGTFPPGTIPPGCADLATIINDAATRNCVPPAVLMAISRMEAGGVWGWTCEEVAGRSQDRWWESATPDELKAAYCYDTCAATGLCSPGLTVMGPMQFEGGTWRGIMPEYVSNNTPYDLMDRCRVDLSFEAAARKVKGNSGTGSDNCDAWDEATVRLVAKSYCGSCGLGGCKNPANPPNACHAACGGEGVDYCENVWLLYEQYASQ